MDIETHAKAMFHALHSRFNRVRNWDAHPDDDSGAGELGRDSFRHMAAAVAAVPEPPPLVSQGPPSSLDIPPLPEEKHDG